jgi:hypothetical protein
MPTAAQIAVITRYPRCVVAQVSIAINTEAEE